MNQVTKIASLVLFSTAFAVGGCVAQTAEPNDLEDQVTTQTDDPKETAQAEETNTTDEATDSNPADSTEQENVSESSGAILWGGWNRPWGGGWGGWGGWNRPWGGWGGWYR